MADARPFLLLDSAGAPLTGATPTAQAWDVTGAARTAPAVVELGDGLYAVTPSDADETAGTVVLVTTGAEPARVTLACYLASRANQFWAWHLEDAAGALWTGAAPTVVMRDATGTRTPAALVVPTAGVYVLVPSSADVTADASVRATSPAGAYPSALVGSVEPVAAAAAPADPIILPAPFTPLPSRLGSNADLSLTWDGASLAADLSIAANDLETDGGLRTAVLLSLFTDRHAEAGDDLPEGETDRRGWWADTEEDRIGSRLWLLGRAKQTPDVIDRASEYAREALQWLVEDAVATRIDVVPEFLSSPRGLGLTVTLHRPSGDPASYRFGRVWEEI